MVHRYSSACLVLLAILLITTSCPGKKGGGEGGEGQGFSGAPPVTVLLEPVQMISYAPAIELVGEIKAAQRTTLVAEVGGRVVRVNKRVGEPIRSGGGALIQIDAANYQVMLDSAKAQLAQAKENLAKAQNGPREQDIAAQEARVAAARAQFEQAQDNLTRQKELFENAVVPTSAVVAAEKQAEAAEASLQAQQEILDSMYEGSRVEDIKAARAAVDLAQSSVDAAEISLSRTSVSVPFDAVVTGLMVEVGTFVGPGTPLAEVVSDQPCEAWFNLPEEHFSEIGPGDRVEVRMEALPDKVIEGEVIAISPAADEQSRQFPVRVSLHELDAKPGMAATGRLLTQEPTQVLAVSRDATVMTNLGEAVWVMVPPAENADPGAGGMGALPSVQQVLVETGSTYEDLVIISGDIQPGALVVSRGNESLYPGAKIIPVNMDKLMGAMGEGGGMPPGMAPSGNTQEPDGTGDLAGEHPEGSGESDD